MEDLEGGAGEWCGDGEDAVLVTGGFGNDVEVQDVWVLDREELVLEPELETVVGWVGGVLLNRALYCLVSWAIVVREMISQVMGAIHKASQLWSSFHDICKQISLCSPKRSPYSLAFLTASFDSVSAKADMRHCSALTLSSLCLGQ